MWKAHLDNLSRLPGEGATHYTAQMYLLPAYVADLILLSKVSNKKVRDPDPEPNPG
jgi:hypothetical protein